MFVRAGGAHGDLARRTPLTLADQRSRRPPDSILKNQGCRWVFGAKEQKMTHVFFWTIVFSLSTAVSIALLGDRSLISGNLFEVKNFMRLITHYKFVLAVIFAVFARFSFIFINNSLLKVERLAGSSTTVTAFICAVSFIFVVITNTIFLQERLSVQQGVGSLLVLAGVWMLLK
jgi:drug/metabolite transporter (DMT)-like permease